MPKVMRTNDHCVLGLKLDTHDLLQSAANIVDEGQKERLRQPMKRRKLSYRLVMTVAFVTLPQVELPAYSLHKTNTLKSW